MLCHTWWRYRKSKVYGVILQDALTMDPIRIKIVCVITGLKMISSDTISNKLERSNCDNLRRQEVEWLFDIGKKLLKLFFEIRKFQLSTWTSIKPLSLGDPELKHFRYWDTKAIICYSWRVNDVLNSKTPGTVLS